MLGFASALVATLLATACSNNAFPTLPTEPAVPPTVITDTFEGQLTVNGAVSHPFVVTRAGSLSATLTAIEPEDAIIGVGLGTWNSGTNSCALIITNDLAPGGAVLVGTASVAGNFCVRVNDVGKLTGTAGYFLTVAHF
jgi:hypothetical protein